MIVIKVNYTTDQPIIKVNYDDAPIYISTSVDATYINVDYGTGGGGGGGAIWGDIIGNLSDQLDLQAALDDKVPYTGATGDVDLGEYELKAGQIELDQSPTGTAGVAVTRWNDTIGSTETTLKGGNVILKNGVDLVARIVNKVTPNTTLTKAAYQAVRISGAQGQRLAVAFAQANNDNNSADTIGLVTETIATNQEGFIITVGNLEGINTTGSLQGETWTDGDVLYLSPTVPGAITNVKPIAPQHLVVIGYVEYAHANNGKIYVKVMNGWELGELHDVDTTGATNGQVLKYNGSIWTPQNDLNTGTVTSVDLSAPTGFVVSGNPITSSGTLALSFASGYSLPTTIKQGNWDDAYTFVSGFPSQTGNSGKYLTTDGSTLSWGTISTANIYNSDGTLTGNRTVTSGGFNLTFTGSNTASSAIARGLNLTHTLVAAANNDVLVGLDINPTFTNGAFTGITNAGLRVGGSSGLLYDIANTRLNIGSGAGSITNIANLNIRNSSAVVGTSITNSSTTGQAGMWLTNNINAIASFFKNGSALSSYRTILAGDAGIYNGDSGDIVFQNDNTAGKIKFGIGNSSDAKATLTAAGRLLLGTTTESTYLLDVNGTGRFTGNVTIHSQANPELLIQPNVITGSARLKIYNSGSTALGIHIATGTSDTGFPTQLRNMIGLISPYGYFISTNGAGAIGTSDIAIFAFNSKSVSFNSVTEYASAQVAIDSTIKGFLPPRMTAAQKTAISTPATGLVIYQTDSTEGLYQYKSTGWEAIGGGGTNIYNSDGTLTGNRTVTANGNSLTFLGGVEEIADGQIGLRLQGSATTKNIWLSLKNTNVNGKDYIFYSRTNGLLTIAQWNGTIGTNVYSVNNLFTQITANGFDYLFASDTVYNVPGLWMGIANGSQTLANSTLLKNGNETILSSNSIVRFYNGANDTGRIYASTGNWLIQTGGTFTDAGYKLDVQGTTRLNGVVTLSGGTGGTNSSIYGSAGNGLVLYAGQGSVTDFLVTTRSGASAISLSNSTGLSMLAALIDNVKVGGLLSETSLTRNGTIGLTLSGYNSATNFSVSLVNSGIAGLFVDHSARIKIGLYTDTFNNSAILDIVSTNKGFLPPRMTETQKNAISTPATGLVIYQTDGTEGLYQYKSTGWSQVAGTGGGGGISRSVNVISTTTTAGASASTDYVYLISGTTTLTLPTAVGNTNRYTLKNVGTNTVTINTTSSQTIDGSTSITMAVRYTALDVISDGTNWNII